MKLGPLTLTRTPPPIDLAQNKRSTRIDSGEVGATGTVIFGGILGQTDYNLDLQPPLSYDVYDKMRKGDGQVRAALSAIKLPLLRAEWTVEPASDSAEDKEIALFVEEGLQALSSSWQQTLRHILLHLDYGSMPLEKVWEVRDDKRVHLRKLAPRLPRTIMRWQLDDNGGIKAITQNAMKGGGMSPVDIPIEKLLLFVNELEGSDYRGQSILRSAYKHWFFKDGLYRVDAIAKEKRSIGVDVGTLAGDVTPQRREDMERALMRMRAHEKQFFTEIEGEATYRVEGVGAGRALDALGSIEHHDLRIVRSVLAEFLAMGQGASGSRAMHLDKTSFFLMALASTADYICDIFNSHLIPQWVDYNWTVSEYPKMTHSRLDTRDALETAQAVAVLMGSGGLTANRDTENSMRELLELPELPEDQPLPSELPAEEPLPLPVAARRETQRQIVQAATAVRDRQVTNLVDVARTMFGTEKAPSSIEVRYRSDLAASVRDLLPADSQAEKAFLADRARAFASRISDRLKSEFVYVMTAQLERGEFDEADLSLRLTAASDRELGREARALVAEAAGGGARLPLAAGR